MLDKFPEQQKPQITEAKDVREAAFRLLARREHSQCELLRKLMEKGFSSQCCTEVIQQLANEGYQSQRRFTEMWINSRAAKFYGENKIRSELAQHQISSALITEVFNDAEVDWFELCLHSFRKKFGAHASDDWTLKQKQKRHLWQRGFTDEQISYAISTARGEG